MSKKNERNITKYLKTKGYVIVRDKKHLVFKNTIHGRIIVVSRTPSDYRSDRNTMRDVSLQMRACEAAM